MNNKVELLGYYGSDITHAQSAWTSTSRDITDEKKARIPKLLTMLASEGHETPFEKSSFHFLVTVDQATHIHLLKHRIGVSINGESARYKELKEDKTFIPTDWPEDWQDRLELLTKTSNALYHSVLEALTPTLGRKRAKESARFFKMFNSQIDMDLMFNFRSFVHFQRLRNSEHAQKEVRELAQMMLDLVKGIEGNPFEHTLEAFNL
jgi:flavin-dependent thymidylate synthase